MTKHISYTCFETQGLLVYTAKRDFQDQSDRIKKQSLYKFHIPCISEIITSFTAVKQFLTNSAWKSGWCLLQSDPINALW